MGLSEKQLAVLEKMEIGLEQKGIIYLCAEGLKDLGIVEIYGWNTKPEIVREFCKSCGLYVATGQHVEKDYAQRVDFFAVSKDQTTANKAAAVVGVEETIAQRKELGSSLTFIRDNNLKERFFKALPQSCKDSYPY